MAAKDRNSHENGLRNGSFGRNLRNKSSLPIPNTKDTAPSLEDSPDTRAYESRVTRSRGASLTKSMSRRRSDRNGIAPVPFHTQADSISFLPSAVPESLETQNLLGHVILPTGAKIDTVNTRGKRMSVPDDSGHGTQQLSQSIYESILQKQKSVSLPEQEINEEIDKEVADREDNNEEDEQDEQTAVTQLTLNEGDEGHIDLASSFVTHHEAQDDVERSEPPDFSPTQTRHQLTHFPESQRFKTPATTSKKKNCDANTDDTPAHPRNPLAVGSGPTPSRLMGLSQAFAGTQAASSPFSNGLPTVLRSDRPSPGIALQTRPVNVSSSPLRSITDFRRAATEPASRYVPMKQSQAERQRQEEIEQANVEEGDSDDFEEDSSLTKRRRREKVRERMIRTQLQAASSPVSPVIARALTLSPQTKTLRQNADETRQLRTPANTRANDPDLLSDNILEHESEADTDEDEHQAMNARRLNRSQVHDEEDKENHNIDVQRTVVQLQRVVNDSVSEVDASPCIRHLSTILENPGMHSSGPVRIADSQPSQEASVSPGPSRHVPGLTTDIVDSIVSEPRDEADVVVQPRQNLHPVPGQEASMNLGSTEPVIVSSESISGYSHRSDHDHARSLIDIRSNTVPGTSSERRHSQSESRLVTTTGEFETNTTDPSTRFDTAQTHQTSNPVLGMSSQTSSQPVVGPSSGRRRRRMMDVSAQSSPLKSTPTFNAAQILQLDADQDMVQFLESPPRRRITYGHKRRCVGSSPMTTSIDKGRSQDQSHGVSGGAVNDVPANDINVQQAEISPDVSQEIVQPVRQNRLARASAPSDSTFTSPLPRRSVWDLEASPAMKSVSASRRAQIVCKTQKQSLAHQEAASETPFAVPAEHDPSRGKIRPNPSMESEATPRFTGSTPHEDVIAPNMVFACFNGKVRAYYPATCLGLSGSETLKYTIQWDGYDPDEVDSYGVKPLDLRVGDIVKVNLDKFPKVPHVVLGFRDKTTQHAGNLTDIRGHRTIVIAPKQRKSLPGNIISEHRYDIPISAIYLDSNQWQQMKKRNFGYVPFVASNSGYATPTNGPGTPSTPSSRGRRVVAPNNMRIVSTNGFFENMAFAISYEDPARKNKLHDLVQSHGGLVLKDSFHDLLQLDEISLKPEHEALGFTALLTERHSRKEKFMQALALNLPCLSGRWVEACVKANARVDWQPYLLPAGESADLDGVTRSRILPQMISSEMRLRDMLSTRLDVLAGASVVIVIGKGKAEVKRLPYIFLIKALGAGTIHKMLDVNAAKDFAEANRDCHWIFVDDRDLEAAQSLVQSMRSEKRVNKKKRDHESHDRQTGCIVAGNELIVQSLILGKLYEG